MSVAETITPTDQKAGYSSWCRREEHGQCATVRAKCECDCHRSARAFIKAQKPNAKSAKSAPPSVGSAPEDGKLRGKKASGVPLFELVRADPPEPARRKTIAEEVRPLLEEIMVIGEHCWYRIVLYPARNQAAFNVARLRNAYSPKEWEFRGAKVPEIDQSAVYTRWLGTKEKVL